MPSVATTEQGGSGAYVRYSHSSLNNLGSCTIVAYAKPSGSGGGGFGYLFGKTTGSSTDGFRFFVDYNGGSQKLTLGASSGDPGLPTASTTAGSVTNDAWAYFTGTCDGSINGSGIALQINGTSQLDAGSATDGSSALIDDSANDVYLINRSGTTRDWAGDVAWVAVWNRVLNSTELAKVVNGAGGEGPLDVPSGLVLCFANDQDYAQGLTQTARSSRVTGSAPTYTALGGGVELTGAAASEATATGTMTQESGQAMTGAAAAEATASGTMTQDVGLAGAAAAEATASGTLNAASIAIHDGYDRASVNLAASSVVGTGNSAVITIRPKMQYFEFVSESRWLEPSARVVGVNGLHPTFKFDSYDNAGPSANNYHGSPWDSTRFPMYSYDRETWHYFENKTVGASDITFYNTSDFTSDTVYIGRSRQMSVEQVGAWIDSLEAAYPTIIEPTITAASHTPSVDVAGFSGQDFIADEFSAQVGAWGTIPITPLYAFQINDTSLTPYGGGAKRVAIITSGVHAGEDHANYVLKAVVAAMLGSSAEAQALRRNYKILIYPLINAPGRYGGGWRGSFVTGTSGEDDANRYFSNTGTGLEIINLPKAAMVADLNGATPTFGIDFHGTYVDPWEVFSNATAATGETFRARLAAVAGYAVVDVGALHSGGLSEYLRNILGANPAFTHESGDPVKVTDAEITDHGGYIVQVLGEQMAGWILGGEATAEATATGSMTQEISVSGAAAAEATASGTMSVQEPVPPALASMTVTLDDISTSITAQATASASVTVTLGDIGFFAFGHNAEYVAPVNKQSSTAIATFGKMM